jgi:hypothetical protein
MDAPAPTTASPRVRRRPAPDAVAAWLLGFAPAVYLALDGGGYDLVVRSQVGLLCWWLVVLGALVGTLPRTPPGPAAWTVLGLFGGLLLWTWLGADWSTSAERSLAEAGRVASYAGVLVLGVGLIHRGNLPALLAGLACAIGLVSGLAVLSRLAPALFPADPSKAFVAVSRLDYPFNYADAVGEFAALGLPLLLYLSVEARTAAGRGLAAAGLPLIALCVTLSVSRGGALACGAGLVVLLALTPRRLAVLGVVLAGAAGSAVVIAALLSRPGLRSGAATGPTLAGERHQMLVIVVAVGLGVAALQVAVERLGPRLRPPAWVTPGPRVRRGALGGAAALAVAVLVLAAVGGGLDDLWREFKAPYVQGGGDAYSRLLTISGSHRYQFWQAAVGAWESSPWHGIGPGTFEFWWAGHNTLSEFARNAHSLYFETLAELGVVGLVLVCTILGGTLLAGSRAAVRVVAQPRTRPALAASVAGLAGFAAAAGFDWVWQFAAIPTVGLLLAGASLSGGRASPGRARSPLVRVILVLATGPALAAIAVPLATTAAVRSSQTAARTGDYGAALGYLLAAERVEPAAASPRLEQALVYEQAGALPEANRAIDEASSRQPTDWRIWLVASRLAAELGRPGLAVSEYRRARSLNPTSVLFRQP